MEPNSEHKAHIPGLAGPVVGRHLPPQMAQVRVAAHERAEGAGTWGGGVNLVGVHRPVQLGRANVASRGCGGGLILEKQRKQIATVRSVGTVPPSKK